MFADVDAGLAFALLPAPTGPTCSVLAAYLVVCSPVSRRVLGRARGPAVYALGIVAAYWSWSRIAAF